MSITSAIVIVTPEHLAAVKDRLADAKFVGVIGESDLLQVQDSFLSRPPDILVMHSAFATTSRGATLISAIKAKTGAGGTAIRVFIEDDVKSPLILAEASLSPLDALLETTRPLERAGTRQAARYPMNRFAVAVNGENGQLIDLSISGAQVQVVAPTRGTAAVTDENGQFLMPWPFTGTVTVRASKEGFHSREYSTPEPGAPRYPVSLGFELEAIDSPIIVAGMYDMTFTAANECTQLPTVARQRSYRAQMYPNGRGRFTAMVFNIEPHYNTVFDAEVRGEPPQTLRVHVVTDPSATPAIGIVERIGPDIFLEVIGSTELPLGARSATAAFDGTFAVCPAEVAVSYSTAYRCPVQPTTCRSAASA